MYICTHTYVCVYLHTCVYHKSACVVHYTSHHQYMMGSLSKLTSLIRTMSLNFGLAF